jgi:hypothetical protein
VTAQAGTVSYQATKLAPTTSATVKVKKGASIVTVTVSAGSAVATGTVEANKRLDVPRPVVAEQRYGDADRRALRHRRREDDSDPVPRRPVCVERQDHYDRHGHEGDAQEELKHDGDSRPEQVATMTAHEVVEQSPVAASGSSTRAPLSLSGASDQE